MIVITGRDRFPRPYLADRALRHWRRLAGAALHAAHARGPRHFSCRRHPRRYCGPGPVGGSADWVGFPGGCDFRLQQPRRRDHLGDVHPQRRAYARGIADIIGRNLLRAPGQSEARLVAVVMLIAGVLSGIMNNVGVAALMLPVVVDISRRPGIAPSRLLMPMAYGTLLGGAHDPDRNSSQSPHQRRASRRRARAIQAVRFYAARSIDSDCGNGFRRTGRASLAATRRSFGDPSGAVRVAHTIRAAGKNIRGPRPSRLHPGRQDDRGCAPVFLGGTDRHCIDPRRPHRGAARERDRAAGLYGVTAVETMIVPTAALVVLMAPITLSASAELGISPQSAMMAIAIAASASFASPIHGVGT